MPHYQHTQVGWVILAAILAPAIIIGLTLSAAETDGVLYAVATLLALTALGFGALTVTVDATRLVAAFGVVPLRGWFRKRIALADIASYRRVRNRWWYGFGIRYIGRGWLYNVAGLDAVEIQLASGTLLRIGTDEPEALLGAITQATGRPADTGPRRFESRRDGVARVSMVAVIVLAVVALLLVRGCSG